MTFFLLVRIWTRTALLGKNFFLKSAAILYFCPRRHYASLRHCKLENFINLYRALNIALVISLKYKVQINVHFVRVDKWVSEDQTRVDSSSKAELMLNHMGHQGIYTYYFFTQTINWQKTFLGILINRQYLIETKLTWSICQSCEFISY